MNRRLLLPLALVLALGAPGLAYEALEKTAERIGPRGHWLALSLTAERNTRWRPTTGHAWLDHALHEVEETRHFWRLVGRDARSAPAVAAIAVR